MNYHNWPNLFIIFKGHHKTNIIKFLTVSKTAMSSDEKAPNMP